MNSPSPESYGLKINSSAAQSLTAGILGVGASVARSIPGLRDKLAEPLDFFSHVGNLNGSIVIGYLAGLVAGKVYERTQPRGGEQSLRRRARIIMGMGGLAAGMAVNTVLESKYGMKLLGVGTTGDAIDFAYGTASAGVAGALLSEVDIVPNPTDEDPRDTQGELEVENSTLDLGEGWGLGQSALEWPDEPAPEE